MAANRDPRMGNLYTSHLNAWRDNSGKLFAYYKSCISYSKWDSWGALEYITHPRGSAPKYDATETFIEESEC